MVHQLYYQRDNSILAQKRSQEVILPLPFLQEGTEQYSYPFWRVVVYTFVKEISSISKANVYQHYLLLTLDMFRVIAGCNINLTLPLPSLWMRRTSYSLPLFICPKTVSTSHLSPLARVSNSMSLTNSFFIDQVFSKFLIALTSVLCFLVNSASRFLNCGHSCPAEALPVLSSAEGSFHVSY